MRAVIIATGVNENMPEFKERFPLPLFPLMGRPFIHLLVERLVDGGITKFDFILSHLPEKIEASLGTGARWGAEFRYHLARDASRPYGLLKTLLRENRENVLLAHADRLPLLPEFREGFRSANKCIEDNPRRKLVLYCRHIDSELLVAERQLEWMGWALLTPDFLEPLPLSLDEVEFAVALKYAAKQYGVTVNVNECLSLRSYEHLLDAKSKILSGNIPELLPAVQARFPGIWIASNAEIDSSVAITPPIFIGEGCRIGPGVHLGPESVIENTCVLESDCTITNSIILPSSYIGEGLELSDAIVDKSLLVNVRLDVAISVTDNFLLGNLSSNQIQSVISRLLSRMIAAVLLLFLWPLLLFIFLWLKFTRPGPVIFKKECVRSPTAIHTDLKTFSLYSFRENNDDRTTRINPCLQFVRQMFLILLPALINIARGELHFVGVKPRTKAELRLLPDDWRAIYLRTKVGIVTEADVRYGPDPDYDDLLLAECYYANTGNKLYDLRLLCRFFLCLISDHYISQKVDASIDEGRHPNMN